MARIKGMSALVKSMERFHEESQQTIKDVLQEMVDKMIADAKANAPRDLARLIDSIDKENRDNGWTVVFFVGEVHGAFQEFGTGPQVDVPPELADQAMQFKGYKSGNFQQFLEAIEGWCARHGIEQRAAWPIAMAILRRGLKPQPYFYPAYLKYRDEIIPEMRKRFNALAIKFNRG